MASAAVVGDPPPPEPPNPPNPLHLLPSCAETSTSKSISPLSSISISTFQPSTSSAQALDLGSTVSSFVSSGDTLIASLRVLLAVCRLLWVQIYHFRCASLPFYRLFLCILFRSVSLRVDVVLCIRRLISPMTKVLCISPLVRQIYGYFSSVMVPRLVSTVIRFVFFYGPVCLSRLHAACFVVEDLEASFSPTTTRTSTCRSLPNSQFGHRSSISETLPKFIGRVLVLRAGCLFLPLPRFQVLFSSFDSLIASYALRFWVCPYGTFDDLYLASDITITALCSPFTAVCRSIFGVFRALAPLLWQREVFMAVTSFHLVNRVLLDFYCPLSSSVEFVFLSDFSLALNWICRRGFSFEDFTGMSISAQSKDSAKWRFITSVFVAGYVIENCALAAVSISGCRPLNVFSNSQGFDSPFSSIGVEIRGLLSDSSSSSVLFAAIYLCCISLFSCLCCLSSHDELLSDGSVNFCFSHLE